MGEKITISQFFQAKKARKKFSAVSCYDFTSAALCEQAGAEMLLVGDSAAQFMLGHASTLPVSMDFMITITKAVARASKKSLVVADMPFMSYQTSASDALKNAAAFMTQGGAELVKVEVSEPYIDTVKALSDAGIPVMAHLGIRPQTIARTGTYTAQGTTAENAHSLIILAEKMIQAGAVFLLLEGTARETAALITENSSVPVLSCGSGPDCDGQVLVLPDIIGLTAGKKPKFSQSFAGIGPQITRAVDEYVQQVRQGKYPDDDHSYHIKTGELQKLKKMLETS